MRRQREMERKLAAMSGGLLQGPPRRQATGRRAKAATARAAGDAGPAEEPVEGSSAEEGLAEQDAAAGSNQEDGGEEDGWLDGMEDPDQDAAADESELQLLLRAPHSSSTLPKIMFEMDEADRPPPAGAGGSAGLGEEGDAADSDSIGSDGALPSRIAAQAYKRHR